ncbi:CAP domain-containing protein [Lutibacter sp. B1]|uniref:CAP domain-containing protein n=1 Tax=Lutibacter sp. B1 TaxID=2725996 RepID=UPI0014578519|nr:CAP domain-containing protein [Lutibacter sp. B1]NLP59187.1 CAP domain-containing protein [Lutibacter sp. B1]
MKTLAFKLFFTIIIITLLVSCSTDDDGIYLKEENMQFKDVHLSYSEFELDILNEINEYRESKGLSTLEILNIVSTEAISHTKYMIELDEINHDNFSIRTNNLMKNASAKTVGENVAYGYSTAKGVLNGWLNSESHRKIIENNSFTHFGISVLKNNNDRYYYTNIFIKR